MVDKADFLREKIIEMEKDIVDLAVDIDENDKLTLTIEIMIGAHDGYRYTNATLSLNRNEIWSELYY